jgi:hypothetical protein
MRAFCLMFPLMLWGALPLEGQDVDATDVRVTLDSALRIAQKTAASAFPELSNYLLYSITHESSKGIRADCIGRCSGRNGRSLTAEV